MNPSEQTPLPTFIDTFDQECYDFDKSCEEAAAQRGLNVVYPQANQLQLDIDSEAQFAEFERRFPFFGFNAKVDIRPSASGLPKRHITITIEGVELTTWQRIALQAALASDPIREFLSARRLWLGTERPSCLFELPTT